VNDISCFDAEVKSAYMKIKHVKEVDMMEKVISMRNVRKSFQENVALKNLTFDVYKNEIFGFLGPSGAGKTTTIKILTSQLIQNDGEVEVFQKEVRTNKHEVFRNIGVLSDNSGLYERLTVHDNLKIFAEINGVPLSNIDEILEKVDLIGEKKKEVKKLSKGMKQRLMLARAVLHKPKLLFLDEPTSSLDPGTTLEVHKLLLKLNEEGTTIFLTTHNMFEADKLCDRVAFLNAGEIVELGNPDELKLKYGTDEISVITRSERKNLTMKNDGQAASTIHQLMLQNDLLSIHSVEPNLEQIFLKLTGREL